MGVWQNLLGFPGDLVVFEGVGNRNRPTIKNHKFFVKVDVNVKIIDFMFPFFIHFVFEGKLNVITVDFHTVNKKKGYFVRAEDLCSHDIVDYGFGFVSWNRFKLNLHVP